MRGDREYRDTKLSLPLLLLRSTSPPLNTADLELPVFKAVGIQVPCSEGYGDSGLLAVAP